VRFVYGAKDLYVALNSTASVAEEPFQPAKPDYNDEDPIANSTTNSTTSPGARRLSYVIATDNRRAITSTTTYPWCGF
jgi:V8-like Glu-specific endopeptidase